MCPQVIFGHVTLTITQDKDENPVIVNRLSEGDGAGIGQAVAAKTTMENSSSGEGLCRELSKFSDHIHQNHPAQLNSTPYSQSHDIIGATIL
ncbi:hypothetical protein PV326_012790 [Microctonus aethiopoides]|nr:hypothetical protein PV326_012790 [Microctonus aethiopoides]